MPIVWTRIFAIEPLKELQQCQKCQPGAVGSSALVGEFELFSGWCEIALQLVGSECRHELRIHSFFVKGQGLLLAGGGVQGRSFARISQAQTDTALTLDLHSCCRCGYRFDSYGRQSPLQIDVPGRSSTHVDAKPSKNTKTRQADRRIINNLQTA